MHGSGVGGGDAVEDDMCFGVPVAPRGPVGWVGMRWAWDGGAGAEGFIAGSGLEAVSVVHVEAVCSG